MEAKLYQALSKKLGWGGMLASIALPAIDRIITNHVSHICDVTGDVLAPGSVAASLLLKSWTPDEIFSLLLSPDYLIWNNEKEFFILLRDEIERCMKEYHMNYEQAIQELYKQTFNH